MRILRGVLVLLATLVSLPAPASFHTFQLNEFYSNADGSIQFIELREAFGANSQNFLMSHSVTSTQGGTTHTYVFPGNLPNAATANKSVLIATPGFAALGIVTPDYLMPAGFLFVNGGTVDYAGVDSVTYAALPAGGVFSLDRNGTTGVNSPRNFADAMGTIPAPPPPPPPPVSAIPVPLFDTPAIALLTVLLGLSGAWLFRRRG